MDDNGQEAPAPPAPVFIVGCQRSGTTLLRLMLDSHPRISCGPETRFLEGLARMSPEVSRRMPRFGFAADHWDSKIARAFDDFQSEYARRRGKVRWVDKTPRYALLLDYLDRLFPTCQIVHVIRDGRDVVTSHVARWGYWAGLKAVQKWPRYVQRARRAGRRLSDNRYLEVRYEELVAAPEEVLRCVLEFIGEPWDAAVLDYRDHPHDVGPLFDSLTGANRESEGSSSIYGSRVGAHAAELDPVLRILFAMRAGRLLRRLGYRG